LTANSFLFNLILYCCSSCFCCVFFSYNGFFFLLDLKKEAMILFSFIFFPHNHCIFAKLIYKLFSLLNANYALCIVYHFTVFARLPCNVILKLVYISMKFNKFLKIVAYSEINMKFLLLFFFVVVVFLFLFICWDPALISNVQRNILYFFYTYSPLCIIWISIRFFFILH